MKATCRQDRTQDAEDHPTTDTGRHTDYLGLGSIFYYFKPVSSYLLASFSSAIGVYIVNIEFSGYILYVPPVGFIASNFISVCVRRKI